MSNGNDKTFKMIVFLANTITLFESRQRTPSLNDFCACDADQLLTMLLKSQSAHQSKPI